MSDFESFSGSDTGANSMDPNAFEKFKERMAAAAAQLKAMQIGEQKQKKTEDELIKILLKFIQSGQKRDLMLLVSRLLEENIPAGFIVALLLISNQEMQQQLGLKMLPAAEPASYEGASFSATQAQTLPDHYIQDSVLPLKIKIAIDNWVHQISQKAGDNPHRLLRTAIDAEGQIKLPVIQLASFSLRDFLEEQGIKGDYNRLKDFMELMLDGIFKKLREQIAGTKEIKEGQI